MAKKTKAKYELGRPPVVTMLGHVDHGKTSILDAIRGTKVQSCEAGGITQKVRAHQVEYTTDGQVYPITFIDTPGHEAFSNMRSRGASVTDIAVLVVAADDSVQPQTKEAIEFAHKSKVPIIVALNKVDIEGVDKAKVKRELSQVGVQVEELGGDVMCIETSATKKTGIDELLNAILLVAELNQLAERKPERGNGEGVVLESTLDKSLGAISLCLVQAGSVRVGDYFCWKTTCGKVRALKDETFCDKDLATSSVPVWIAGFDDELPVGTIVHFFDQEQLARSEAKSEKEQAEESVESISEEKTVTEELSPDILAQLLGNAQKEDIPQLNLILRTDSQGTLEVVKQELEELSSDEVRLNIVDTATGEITEEDIHKAQGVGGVVIGFNSRISKNVQKVAKQEKVLVRNYEIIYELLEEIAEVVESLIKPVDVEIVVARAQVKKVFQLTNGTLVAGCKVTKGTVVKGYRCFVERASLKKDSRIGDSKIVSLRHGKNEVREAGKDTECGILLDPQLAVEKDDEIVCFKVEKQ